MVAKRNEFTRETNLYSLPTGKLGCIYVFAVDYPPVCPGELLASRRKNGTVTAFNQIYLSSDGGQTFEGIQLLSSDKHDRPVRPGSGSPATFWSCRVMMPFEGTLLPTDLIVDPETLTFNYPLAHSAKLLTSAMVMLGRVCRDDLRDEYPDYEIHSTPRSFAVPPKRSPRRWWWKGRRVHG